MTFFRHRSGGLVAMKDRPSEGFRFGDIPLMPESDRAFDRASTSPAPEPVDLKASAPPASAATK